MQRAHRLNATTAETFWFRQLEGPGEGEVTATTALQILGRVVPSVHTSLRATSPCDLSV